MICENCNHDLLAHGTHGCIVGSALDESQYCTCLLDYTYTRKIMGTPHCPAQAPADSPYPYLQCERAHNDPHTEGYHRACVGSYTGPDARSTPEFFCWEVSKYQDAVGSACDNANCAGSCPGCARPAARDAQVGGDHYRKFKIQPWDIWEEYGLDPWLAGVVKYVLRAGRKGSKLEDLRKARHYLDRAIEIEEGK
jgi:uncharacterized protein DUF3310